MSKTPLVLIEPDAFIGTANTVSAYIPQYGQSSKDTLKNQAEAATARGWDLNDIATVSRPVNGMSVKPNTHAFVQVLRENGTPVYLFNQLGVGLGKSEEQLSLSGQYGSGKYGDKDEKYTQQKLEDVVAGAGGGTYLKGGGESLINIPVPNLSFGSTPPKEDKPDQPKTPPNKAAWTDWILQSVREQRMERTQVVETFGDTYLYAFGERPRALQFQGLLLNSLDYNWRAVFWENWDRYFRATKLIELGARMYIGWEDIIVEGYPINAAAAETADSPNAMTFQFTFYVTNYINTSAQSGFMAQQRARISRIRGGYTGGPGSAGKTDDLAQFFRSNHGLEYIGPYGATQAGGAVNRAMSKWAGDSEKAQALSRFTGSALSDLIDGLGKGLLSYAVSESIGNQFLTNWTRQFAYNSLKFWAKVGIGEAEKGMGVQRGEINAWFGFIANVVDRISVSSRAGTDTSGYKPGQRSPAEMQAMGGGTQGSGGPGSTQNNPNWIGAPAGFGENMSEAFMTGSIDRMLGAMAFSIGAGRLGDDTRETAYSKAVPGAATLVQMKPLEDVIQYGNEGLGTTQVLGLGATSGYDAATGAQTGSSFVTDSNNTWGQYEAGSFDAGSSPITDF